MSKTAEQAMLDALADYTGDRWISLRDLFTKIQMRNRITRNALMNAMIRLERRSALVRRGTRGSFELQLGAPTPENAELP